MKLEFQKNTLVFKRNAIFRGLLLEANASQILQSCSMKDWGVLLPVLCHVFASALEMKCSLNANSCCWLSGSNKAWPPIVIYVKMGYITCSDFDGFVSQTEPSTVCKIAKFARKMGVKTFIRSISS